MDTAELFLYGLAIALVVMWTANWIIHIVALIHGKRRLHWSFKNVNMADLPGISILKPIVGVDPNLYENLQTYFKLRYPIYELIFCLQDEHDAAGMIVQSLIDKYPKVDTKTFIGKSNVGINPKINNMIRGYEAAKYDLVLISDSGIKMSEDTLLDMQLTLTEKVGLVHQMPYATTRNGVASHAEKIYFGTSFAKWYLINDVINGNCAAGMSTLFRKDVLDKHGGLRKFSCYLAEDFFIAQVFQDWGWLLRISSGLAQQNHGTYSISQLNHRICRWMKLRHVMLPHFMFLEPIFHSMVLGLMNSWAFNYLFGFSPLFFFLVHTLVWFLLDYSVICVLENGNVPFSKLEYLVLWFNSEISYLVLLLKSHWNPNITWRGRKFKLKWGGLAEELYTRQDV